MELLSAMRGNGIKRLIHLSSFSVKRPMPHVVSTVSWSTYLFQTFPEILPRILEVVHSDIERFCTNDDLVAGLGANPLTSNASSYIRKHEASCRSAAMSVEGFPTVLANIEWSMELRCTFPTTRTCSCNTIPQQLKM